MHTGYTTAITFERLWTALKKKSRESRKQALEWYNWLFYVEVLRLAYVNR